MDAGRRPLRMSHLVTVSSAFAGHVLVARLGADGILAELRGVSGVLSPVPGNVMVYVDEQDLAVAGELLLGDAVDEAMDADAEAQELEGEGFGPGPCPWYQRRWVKVTAMVMVASAALSRSV